MPTKNLLLKSLFLSFGIFVLTSLFFATSARATGDECTRASDCGTSDACYQFTCDNGYCGGGETTFCSDNGYECGGCCGSCGAGFKCTSHQCVSTCVPDCSGKDCGGDGCGGSCGSCSDGQTCNNGVCEGSPPPVCTRDCAGKNCGDDGCGGSCGSCTGGDTCNNGTCTGGGPAPTATPPSSCDPTSGELCNSSQTWCCPSCTSQQRNCESVVKQACTVPEDCPNQSSQDQCGVAGCYVQKNCVGGTCEYTCLGTNCDTGTSPTPPPGSGTKTIWGYKVIQGAKVPNFTSYYWAIEPAFSRQVYFNGTPTTAEPFTFVFVGVSGGVNRISADKLNGYELLYSVCYNNSASCSSHLGRLFAPGESDLNVVRSGCDSNTNLSPGKCYVDLNNDKYTSIVGVYWHYVPLPSCTVSLTGPSTVIVNNPLTFNVGAKVPPTGATSIVNNPTRDNYVGLSSFLDWTPAGSPISPGTQISNKSCGMNNGANPSLNCDFSANWTPTAVGDYYVSCRANNVDTSGNVLHGCRPFPLDYPSTHQTYAGANPYDVSCDPGGNSKILIHVKDRAAWWQVKNADVTSGGNVDSQIPETCTIANGCNPVFGLNGDSLVAGGGMPGAPVLKGQTADFSSGTGYGTVSEKNWISSPSTDAVTSAQKFDFYYYYNKIPQDVAGNFIPFTSNSPSGGFFESGGTKARNYYWYLYDGSLGPTLTLNNINLPQDRKVVLIVKNADLKIAGTIKGKRGSSLFMAIVQRNISIDKSVGGSNLSPDIEALLVADGTINTGTKGLDANGKGQDIKLTMHGSFVSVADINQIILQRNLPDNSKTPAEFFEYGPEMLLLYPSIFYDRSLKWQEIAP